MADSTVRLYQWVLQHTLLVNIDTRTPLFPNRNSAGTHELTPAHLQHMASLWPSLPLLYQAVLNKVYNDGGCIFGVRGLGSAYVLRELHNAEQSVEARFSRKWEKGGRSTSSARARLEQGQRDVGRRQVHKRNNRETKYLRVISGISVSKTAAGKKCGGIPALKEYSFERHRSGLM